VHHAILAQSLRRQRIVLNATLSVNLQGQGLSSFLNAGEKERCQEVGEGGKKEQKERRKRKEKKNDK